MGSGGTKPYMAYDVLKRNFQKRNLNELYLDILPYKSVTV